MVDKPGVRDRVKGVFSMFGIYINCRSVPFVDMILSGEKVFETRSRDMLRPLVGRMVYLIETGKGVPMVKGTARIDYSFPVTRFFKRLRQDACIVGTAYDVKPGQMKIFYRLSDVRPVQPFPVPANKVNHGRSYTEF